MSSRRKGKQAVYIGTVPPDWKPCSFGSVPPSFTDVELFEKNLQMWQATGYARTFNKSQLQNRLPGRKWAIVARHLRTRRIGEHPDAIKRRQEQAKGGAA